METPLTLRSRLLPVLAVAFGAPVCAEFLQAYLPSTGDAVMMLVALLVLAPLYGGTALLIREVAVRRGMGWTGRLLLGAAFGVAMTGLVDLSLFTEHRADVASWDELRLGTLIVPLGISIYPLISWVLGHVLMSIGAPLALLDALAPRHRGRPLLGAGGIVVTSVLALIAAALIRQDQVRQYGPSPSLAQTAGVAAAVLVLVTLSLTRVGSPVEPGDRRPVRFSWLVVLGAVGMFLVDATPPTWTGAGIVAAIAVGCGVLVRHWARTRRWSPYEIGALAAGGLIGRTLIGFLAPVPDGVQAASKLGQNALALAAVLAVGVVVARGARPTSRDADAAALPREG